MPKNKLEEVIFTFIMATCMVYGMIVYNIALNTGVVRGITFAAATHELIIMMPIAFVLELFVLPIPSSCICSIMCPIMSLIATFLFNDAPSFGMWIKVWALNFPMAICYQMLYCGPFVRLVFRLIVRRKKAVCSEGKPETA